MKFNLIIDGMEGPEVEGFEKACEIAKNHNSTCVIVENDDRVVYIIYNLENGIKKEFRYF